MWGPFLVVSPASTLPNWADELRKFAPALKLLPYWGHAQERAVLRKGLGDPRKLGTPNAPFHILVTSYQLLVSDEKHFRRTKWQYMVLDEAQALKSSASARWKTLLGFACRNRLLLTGTPVQNTMAELWALLHFIMPTLFDSHEQFAEWFSKGVEGAVNDGAALNAHQLSRLHAILKPFMLRRVKADVETEMAPKTEIILHCSLSARQRALYTAVKNKVSVADLLSQGSLSEKKTLSLMNIVIQLRKVCNHPELFERRPPRASYRFAAPHPTQPLPAPGAVVAASILGAAAVAAAVETLYAPGAHASELSFTLPKLVWRDGMRQLPVSASGSAPDERAALLHCEGSGLTVWSAAHVAASLRGGDRAGEVSLEGRSERSGGCAWSWTRLVDLSPAQAARAARSSCDALGRWAAAVVAAGGSSCAWQGPLLAAGTCCGAPALPLASAASKQRPAARMLLLPWRCGALPESCGQAGCAPLLTPLSTRYLRSLDLLRATHAFLPPATAPPVALRCADRSLVMQQEAMRHDPGAWLLEHGAMVPPPRGPGLSGPPRLLAAVAASAAPLLPLLWPLQRAFGPALRVEQYSLAAALAESGKMQRLDALLKERFLGGHKVLIFTQMTKMLNLLEEYCLFRKWKHLRLDGSTAVSDRRDMVHSFQTSNEHFIFLLSTRAGGLGINLTAADSVIFYESDWNPTWDAQAMDRAHRLGQTKPVTVYRLICEGSVEEKIVRRAQQKQAVQALVMTGGAVVGAGGEGTDVFAPDEVVSLLLDDEELEAQMAEKRRAAAEGGGGGGGGGKGRSHSRAAWPAGGGSGAQARRAIRIDADGDEAAMVDLAEEEAQQGLGDAGREHSTAPLAQAARPPAARPPAAKAPVDKAKAPPQTQRPFTAPAGAPGAAAQASAMPLGRPKGLPGPKLPKPPAMGIFGAPHGVQPPPPVAHPPAKKPRVEAPLSQPVPPPAPGPAPVAAPAPPPRTGGFFKVKLKLPPPE